MLKRQHLCLLPAVLLLTGVFATGAASDEETSRAVQAALAGDQRSEQNRARDRYRHPAETLAFFGLRSDMTVVEMWAGGGWYTEILAPVLRDRGRLIVTTYGEDDDPQSYRSRSHRTFMEKIQTDPDTYRHVEVRTFWPPEETVLAEDGSVDMILTFRNIHSMVRRGQQAEFFAAAYRALKPGGVLGIVQHRASPDVDPIGNADKGYIPEAYVVKLAEAAGLRLDDRSEINANAADTRDYEEGVWTLPPSLRGKEEDKDRYLAIGESDRMTLRFIKPAD